ncbi:hypothetical protein BP5796_11324 [Coleophoma crateriformis]|uniref:MARVEL domain-containing protein n=1 Tax=Coleophoma crateriformis TaxID=565419 RepID=A0A3D8QHW9_9HELO|nr:hypothetical protein BP5796_11324 [Coleophoma crateriformis]
MSSPSHALLRVLHILSSVVVLKLSMYPFNPYLAFTIEGGMSGLYFIAFIAMAIAVARLDGCVGNLCTASRADTVISALVYLFWVISATKRAIQLLNRNEGYEKANDVEKAKQDSV